MQDRNSVIPLHTGHEQSDSELTKTASFTAVSKLIKYSGINLTEEIQDLYTKNYKALLKQRDSKRDTDVLNSLLDSGRG